jgi:hypothetical protein
MHGSGTWTTTVRGCGARLPGSLSPGSSLTTAPAACAAGPGSAPSPRSLDESSRAPCHPVAPWVSFCSLRAVDPGPRHLPQGRWKCLTIFRCSSGPRRRIPP